jgi:hypothetical protein
MRKGMRRTVAVLSLLAATTLGQAAEVCVSCAEPVLTYRCGVVGDDPGVRMDQATQLLCIKEIAAKGNHASCSVDRARKGPCDGALVAVERSASAGNDVSGVAAIQEKTTVPAVALDPDAPPQTVEALAKQSAAQTQKNWAKTSEQVTEGAKAAGKGIESAGTAVGSAAKKTWDCMTSLFSKCR